MKKGAVRFKVIMKCSSCNEKNYSTQKNKRNTEDKLKLNKHCQRCKKHALHTEVKI